ncbi:hypothetical protein TNCV_3693311 [Trichonephila clavipes]|nr:hypothetical protein TNCV_3693311 [Trichonephila clavipes]
MLVRLSRAPVLSGGLRRKTQLFSETLNMAASSKTPPHKSKDPQKFNTPLQVPVFPGSNLCDQEYLKQECIKHGQSCFLGERFRTHCRCPPTFIYNRSKGLCEPYGEHTYMLYDLPVVGLKYLNPDESVDRSSLSTDIVQSIGQAYSNLEFVQLFNFTNAILAANILQEDFSERRDKALSQSGVGNENTGHLRIVDNG